MRYKQGLTREMREKILIILMVLVSVFLFNSCKKDALPEEQNKISVIIDTDVDVDDAMAIMYLLQYSGLSVDGITICGTCMSYPITIITEEGEENGRTKIDSVAGKAVS